MDGHSRAIIENQGAIAIAIVANQKMQLQNIAENQVKDAQQQTN